MYGNWFSTSLALTTAVLVGSVLVFGACDDGGDVLPPSNGGNEEPDPIVIELLTPRTEFTDDIALEIRYSLDGVGADVITVEDASRAILAQITVQPGAVFPWHTHPGPVLVNVAEGEFVYVLASDCVERRYPAGTAFLDPGFGNVHTGFNRANSTTPTVLFATFYGVPPEGPLTITDGVEAPTDCQIGGNLRSH